MDDTRDAMPHPLQPLGKDVAGTLRFKRNAIVCFLLDAGSFDMNALSLMPFRQEDREQFAQLIGSSLAGFTKLPYVREETCEAVDMQRYEGDGAEEEEGPG